MTYDPNETLRKMLRDAANDIDQAIKLIEAGDTGDAIDILQNTSTACNEVADEQGDQ